MADVSALTRDFFGSDPLRGHDAIAGLLAARGGDAIREMIPADRDPPGGTSMQVELRLRALGHAVGPPAIPHLAEVIRSAPWAGKLLVPACFAHMPPSDANSAPLRAILKDGDVDPSRIAIEALGYLGAGWTRALTEFAETGEWETPAAATDYCFEKFSGSVVLALAYMAAKATDPQDLRSYFRQLRDFCDRRQQRLPNHHPDAFTLVARVCPNFTEPCVDALVEYWASASDARHRLVGLQALGAIAPMRVAPLLLDTATDPSASQSVRAEADAALGELRYPQVAQRLAAALRDPATDRTCLRWAFSNLYGLAADWSGLDAFVDELRTGDNKIAAQMRHSLALRGDERCLPELLDGLDHRMSEVRGVSALSLARLLGNGALRHLHGRGDEAGDAFEHASFNAALLRAGDRTRAEPLHQSLQRISHLSILDAVWSTELISAFQTTEAFDPRAADLWRAVARVSKRKFALFTEPAAQKADSASPTVVPGATPAAPAPSTPPERRPSTSAPQTVFVSYSHADKKWLRDLQKLMAPLVRAERVGLWDDTKIQPGKWYAQIAAALDAAEVALFLVSEHFLASEFIMEHELPKLLKYAKERNVQVLWVLLDHCLWEESELKDYQCEHDPKKPLSGLKAPERKRILAAVCRKLADLARDKAGSADTA